LVSAGLDVVALVRVLQKKARVEPGGIGPVVEDRLRDGDIFGRIEVLADRYAEAANHRIRRRLAEKSRYRCQRHPGRRQPGDGWRQPTDADAVGIIPVGRAEPVEDVVLDLKGENV